MAVDVIARGIAANALALAKEAAGAGIFVGYVTNGGSLPTQRPDGTPLQNEDYVRPSRTSEFPFTIGSLTFENRVTRAFYFNNAWEIDPGAIQETKETPVSSSTVESVSGTATSQKVVNSESRTTFDNLCKSLGVRVTLTPSTYAVKSSASTSVTIDYKVERVVADLTSISLLRDEVAIQTVSAGVASGGTFTYTDTLTSGHIYRVKTTDIMGNTYKSDPVTVYATLPCYYGALSGTLVEMPMQKDANATVTYNFEYDKAVYKYPKEMGALTDIIAGGTDGSDSYFDSFDVADDGTYYTYTLKEPCRLDTYQFKFVGPVRP